jgi:hypothetical protein
MSIVKRQPFCGAVKFSFDAAAARLTFTNS